VLLGQKQLEPGKSYFAQLKLTEPILLLPGDRFILRQFSPVVTIGGGVVLDAAPLPRKRSRSLAQTVEILKVLQSGGPEAVLYSRVTRRGLLGLSLHDAMAETGWHPSQVARVATALIKSTGPDGIVKAADLLVSRSAIDEAKRQVAGILDEFHNSN